MLCEFNNKIHEKLNKKRISKPAWQPDLPKIKLKNQKLSLLRKVQFVGFQSFFTPSPKGKRLKTNKL